MANSDWNPERYGVATLSPNDYRYVTVKFGAMFSARRRGDAGPFNNLQPNFMTPEILGYVDAFDGTHVEISTGMFMGDRLYGVTFAGRHNSRSTSTSTLEDAWEAIR